MFISIYNLALFGMLICSHVSADSPQQYQTAQPQMQTNEGHLPTDHNNTMLEIIEKLLQSRREGRNLDDQFNQVYADGHIDQALMQGNDVEARNLIRDKLCGLGLMSCDYEEKRPFYSTIYAQEMPPPPNYHGGPPQRPPPNYHHGPPPPHRIGYGEAPFKGNGRPPTGPGGSYGGPYLEHPPTGAGFGEHGGPTFDKPPPGAVIYGSKPPGPIFSGNGPNVDSHQSPPYAFESFNPVDKIKIGGSSGGSSFYAQQQQQQQQITDAFPAPTNVVVGGSSGSNKADLQQHVHHHYHHLEGAAAANAKVPTVAIPVGGIQSINTDFSTLAQSSAAFNIDQSSSAFAAGFNNAGHGSLLSQQSGSIGDFGGPVHKPNGELYKPPYSLNSLPTPNNELYQPSGSSGIGSFGQGGFAPSSGSYHSQNPDYFKKELHNYGSVPSGNFNSLSTGYGASQYGETARQQFVDCKCVPFNQCPAADRIGRKEDLILPIDPRNLPKDIEALSEVPANATNDATTVSDNTQEKKETNDEGETKRSKRDVANATDKQSNDEDVDIPVDAEGRQNLINLPAIELIRRKVLPTYGVSFGLPSPSIGGYPSNALGDYVPAKNPYFGAIGPDGLNLGLLNVNPLVSVQVVKTEFGDKVVKPLVNLHITPNSNILKNIGNIFKRKPSSATHATHYHHHDHYDGHTYAQHEHEHEHEHPTFHAHPHDIPHTQYASGPSSPYQIVEMVHSKPILEYHTTSNLPSPPSYASYEPQYSHYHHNQHSNHYEHDYNGFTPSYHNEYESQSHFLPQNYEHHDYNAYYPYHDYGFDRSSNISSDTRRGKQLTIAIDKPLPAQAPGAAEGSAHISFPKDRRRRSIDAQQRAYYGNRPQSQLQYQTCSVNEVCCRRPLRPQAPPVPPQAQFGRCGVRNAAGITGRIKNPSYVDGDAEFGEYPWHVAILKKDPNESIYACGGTLIDAEHVITAAHCIKSQNGFDLRARLGEWDVNHDVEFFPYIERDVVSVQVHPEYYAGTLDNDLAVLKLDSPVDFTKNPHISPACLPDKFSDWTGARCWTTGWGKDAFGEHGKYQNILKEVDVPILSHHQCETQLRQTRLGYSYKLNPGFICAGGEEGKDACKGDGGGPLVCERNGVWNAVGIVSWGIGCGQVNVPGVYVRVAHYLDWIQQVTRYYKK